jgi:acetate kinase
MARGILTINAGSSSIKLALFELDEAANAANHPRISSAASRFDLLVITTNEEWMIAHHAQVLLGL